jgi:hypothetical protein
MKNHFIKQSQLLVICSIFTFLFIRCEKDSNTSTDENIGYTYWVGSIPNSCYLLNFYGERAMQIKGKPWMVLKYERVSGEVLDCEMGLSEVTQTAITTSSGLGVSPEPTIDVSIIDFKDKLGLKSSVVLLLEWNVSVYASKSTIINGVQNFSFQANPPIGLGGGYSEEWKFTYTNVVAVMSGGVKNIDINYYMGCDSENNAFNLSKQ